LILDRDIVNHPSLSSALDEASLNQFTQFPMGCVTADAGEFAVFPVRDASVGPSVATAPRSKLLPESYCKRNAVNSEDRKPTPLQWRKGQVNPRRMSCDMTLYPIRKAHLPGELFAPESIKPAQTSQRGICPVQRLIYHPGSKQPSAQGVVQSATVKRIDETTCVTYQHRTGIGTTRYQPAGI